MKILMHEMGFIVNIGYLFLSIDDSNIGM